MGKGKPVAGKSFSSQRDGADELVRKRREVPVRSTGAILQTSAVLERVEERKRTEY